MTYKSVNFCFPCTMLSQWVIAGLLIIGALAQKPGGLKKNSELKMDIQECTGQMDCTTCKKSKHEW